MSANPANPKHAISVSTRSGEDPDAIDDRNSQVYGDLDTLTFSLDHMEGERCERSATGVHSYEVECGVYVCVCCGADGGEV